MTRWQLKVHEVLVSLHATDAATQRPIMEACVPPGSLATSGGGVTALAQAAFHQALERAVQTDAASGNNNAASGNNNAKTQSRAARVEAHITVAVLAASLTPVVADFLPRKCLA